MSLNLLIDLTKATVETLYMVAISTVLSCVGGLFLGTWLFCTHAVKPHPAVWRILSGMVNTFRSIPFIILLVACIPFTRWLLGTSIGIHAAIVPLTLGAIPFFARLVDNLYQSLPAGLIEAGFAMGASTYQMIYQILLPEALPGFIQAVTVTAITLVNYSAMAGTVGGGGLGDLAIRYGYQRFNPGIMVATVILLILMVQLLQMAGDRLSSRFNRQS